MSEDGFDASTAAARAVGEVADTDADDLEDVPETTDEDPAEPDVDDGADPSNSGSDDGADEGGVAVFVLPLFTASEAGPTAPTLREEAGLGERAALFVDGLLDYGLHFSDRLADELQDSLGPVGKWGRAASGFLEDDAAGDGDRDGAEDADREEDVDDDVDEDGATDLPGDAV
jgi:hypothetical protein